MLLYYSSYAWSLLLVLFGIIMSLNSSSLFFVWVGLEVNMFSALPLLFSAENMFTSSPTHTKNTSVMYFISQTVGSLLFLGGSTIKVKEVMALGIIMKLGLLPLLLWYPYFLEKVSWQNFWVFSTIQKMAPLYVLNTQTVFSWSMCLMLGFTLAFSKVILIQKTTFLKGILSWSSLIDSCFMTLSTLVSTSLLGYYFVLYLILQLMLMKFLSWSFWY